MMSAKTKIDVYIEKKENFLKDTNLPFLLVDGIVEHGVFEQTHYVLQKDTSLTVEFSDKIKVNKLTIYALPKSNTFWGTKNPSDGISVSIKIKQNGQWIDCDWEWFDYDGANEVKVLKYPGRYKILGGILSIYNEDLIEIEGLMITARDYDNYLTEIKLTQIFKFNPISFRINEVSTIDDEYKGAKVTVVIFDKDFENKDKIELGDLGYIVINNDKVINFLYCEKIIIDVENYLLTIYFNFILMQIATQKEVSPRTPILGYPNGDCDIAKVIEMLLLQANIHRDLIDLKIYNQMLYIPKRQSLYNELLEVLKVSGDYKFFVANKKLCIRSRVSTQITILEQGESNRRVSKFETTIRNIPVVKIRRTFVDFFDLIKDDFFVNGVFNFVEDNNDNFVIRLQPQGYFSIKNLLLPFRNISSQIIEYRTFLVYHLKSINNYIVIQTKFLNSEEDYFNFIVGQKNYDYSTIFDIKVILQRYLQSQSHYLRFELKIYRESDMQLVDSLNYEGILHGNFNEYLEIKFLNDDSTNFLDITKFGYCYGFFDNIYYDFNTSNVYSYLYQYEQNINNNIFKASKSNTDDKCKLIVNGKVNSDAGSNIRIYYFRKPKEDLRVYLNTNGEELVLEYEELAVLEKVYLTYLKHEDSYAEEGIVNLLTKNLVYTKTYEYDEQQLLVNQLIVFKYNYQEKEKKVFETQITLKDQPFVAKINTPAFLSLGRFVIKYDTTELEYPLETVYIETIKATINFYINTLEVKVVIIPEDVSYERSFNFSLFLTILEPLATKYIMKDNISQARYGVREKTIDNRLLTKDAQINFVIKKYFRYSRVFEGIIEENITTNLNLDVNFGVFVNVRDERLKKNNILKLFEYEHFIDLANNNYETIIKGRILNFEDFNQLFTLEIENLSQYENINLLDNLSVEILNSNIFRFKVLCLTFNEIMNLPNKKEGEIFFATDLKQFIGWNGTQLVVLG